MRAGLRLIRDRAPPAPWPAVVWFAVLFFLLTLRWGTPPSGDDLDTSWAAVVGWAYAHGLHWGRDLVFTYGPLGWLHPKAPYDAALYRAFLVGQVLLGCGYSVLYAAVFRRLPRWQGLAFAVFAPLACRLVPDALMLGGFAAAAVALDDASALRSCAAGVWLALLVALQTTTLALLKFTAFPLALSVCGVGAVLWATQRGRRAALAWTALCGASWLGLWRASGQDLADLSAYVRSSLELATGHDAAMGVDASASILAIGLIVLCVAALALLRWWREEGGGEWRTLALAAHLALCLWIGWKTGYGRADFWHTRVFFPAAALVMFGLSALCRREPRGVMYVGAAALCAIGLAASSLCWLQERPEFVDGMAQRVSQFGSRSAPGGFAAQAQALRQAYALPALRARVGEARVDLFGCAQGVILLNGFRYAPRPVFQTYLAYTAALQRRNEAYYLGPQAPPYVIAKFCPIDGRHPASEDGLALLALLRRYRPVAQENGYLLLQQVEPALAPLPPLPSPERSLALGEWVDVPAAAEPLRLRLDYRLSPWGRLCAALLHEPYLALETITADGRTERHRLIRDVAGQGVLLSPAVSDIASYGSAAEGRAPAILRLRVLPEPPAQAALFEPVLRIGFGAVAWPRRASVLDTAP